MDPNTAAAYAAYGYGDSYAAAVGAAASDHSNDPLGPYGWQQWQQTAQAQQNVAQAQQNQAYQQYQNQQAKALGVAIGQVHGHYGSQQQKNQYGVKVGNFGAQQQQHGQKPNVRSGLGFGGGISSGISTLGGGIGSLGGSEWVQPPSQSHSFANQHQGHNNKKFQSGNFPNKKGPGGFGGSQLGNNNHNNGSGFHHGNAPGWKKNKSSEPKKFDPTGKTPSMLLHELFRNVVEDYEEVGTLPKKYRCSLNVQGQQFVMESTNKKTAKQKCAELAIRSLRPEITITPFEDGVAATPVTGAAATKRNAAAMSSQAMDTSSPQETETVNVKKQKLSPVDSAASLLDLLRKLIAESPIKYVPVFETSDAVKKEGEAMETQEQGEKGWRRRDAEHTIILKFVEQDKVYTKTGVGRSVSKDLVIREALQDLFHVSMDDIKTVVRRNVINKLSHEFAIMQTIHQVCSLSNCTMSIDVEPSEDKPLGVGGKVFFVAKCKIVDHNENDKEVEYKSPSLISKQMAKEYAANEMLKNYFGIDPASIGRDNAAPQGPCSVLHTLLSKQAKNKVSYEYKDNVPQVAGQVQTTFYCDCVVEDKDRYTGSGRSKKLAKNAAAVLALKKIFEIDFDPNTSYPINVLRRGRPDLKVSPLCRDIAEFAKREYHGMCKFYDIQPSNQIACFFLVNEKNEKRLLSIGSSIQYVVEPDTLSGASGTAIIHLDPIVLARRSLIRYFMSEISALEKDKENSIFDRHADGKLVLKSSLRLVLYANYPPICAYSVDDAETKKLSYVTPTSLAPVPDSVMTFDEIKATKTLRVHCTADKLYKWSVLGVQGALLSTLMHPVIANTIFFGSEAPVPDESLKHALTSRVGEPKTTFELESIPIQMRIHNSYAHAWTRGIDVVESLDYNTGRTQKGSPSRFCKSELFEAYRGLTGADTKQSQYAEVKKNAAQYQTAKQKLYQQLEAAGMGKWQTKPTNLADDFSVSAFD